MKEGSSVYVLYAENKQDLDRKSQLFEEHMEPMLQKLERAYTSGAIPTDIPEIPQYLQVCLWGFRQLEYTFVLDALLRHLEPGQQRAVLPVAWIVKKQPAAVPVLV